MDINENELNFIRQFNPDQESTRTLFAQSPYTLNASAIYDNPARGIDANLTFNLFGERLALVSTALPFVYEQPRPDLGFTVRKTIGERWRATLRANNLLNPDVKFTHTLRGQEYIFQRHTVGRSFSVGFSYSIN